MSGQIHEYEHCSYKRNLLIDKLIISNIRFIEDSLDLNETSTTTIQDVNKGYLPKIVHMKGIKTYKGARKSTESRESAEGSPFLLPFQTQYQVRAGWWRKGEVIGDRV